MKLFRLLLALIVCVMVGPTASADDPCPVDPPEGATRLSLENFPLRALSAEGLDRVRGFIPPGFRIFPDSVPDSSKNLLGVRRGETGAILFLQYDNLCCAQSASEWEQRIAIIEKDLRGNIKVFPILNGDGAPSGHLGGVNTAFKRASQIYLVAVFNARGTCHGSLIKKLGTDYIQVPFSFDAGIRESDYRAFEKIVVHRRDAAR
jgi:hypothetical protein